MRKKMNNRAQYGVNYLLIGTRRMPGDEQVNFILEQVDVFDERRSKCLLAPSGSMYIYIQLECLTADSIFF
jgi:hypothetical protein